MKTIEEERAFFSSLLTLLSAQMGSNTEVVLYDLTGSAPKLIDIRNGHISGGAAGIYDDLLVPRAIGPSAAGKRLTTSSVLWRAA